MPLSLRGIVLVGGLFAAACTPPAQPAQQEEPASAASAETSTRAVVEALTAVAAAEIGTPVSLEVTTANLTDDWAYVVAGSRNADGSAIDWMTTNLASRYENGVMDESGAIHALLRKQNGAWVVVEHVIAPTDVAWLDWAARHSVPAGVIDTPAAP